MKFLPFENTTLTTKLSTEEAMNELSKYINKPYRWEDTYRYVGNIEGNTFIITPVDRRPVRQRRSSFEIVGELNASNGETVIDLIMEMARPMQIFCMFWCFSIIVMTIIVLMEPPGVEINVDYPILAASAFLLFPYIVVMHAFNKESSEIKIHLAKIFEAKIKRT